MKDLKFYRKVALESGLPDKQEPKLNLHGNINRANPLFS